MTVNYITIRGASGLGDSIYLYPVVKYILGKGHQVEVQTNFPQVFEALPCKTSIYDKRKPVDIECSYIRRKGQADTNQFEDTLIEAGITAKLPFRMEILDKGEIRDKLDNKPVCLVKQPSYLNRGIKKELNGSFVPRAHLFQKIINTFKHKYFFVAIGFSTELKYSLEGIDLDLTDGTTVYDVFQLVKISSMIITQSGFLLPMAETQGKRCFVILSKEGMRDPNNTFIRMITPNKIKCAETTEVVVDDDSMGLQRFDVFQSRSKNLNFDCFINKPMRLGYSKLQDLVEGKRVAVLGSAPSVLDNKAEDIFDYDCIVRVNNYDLKKYNAIIGDRTDIYYSYFGSSIKKTIEDLQSEGVKYIMHKLPNEDFRDHNDGKTQMGVSGDWRNFHTHALLKQESIPIYIPSMESFKHNFNYLNRVLTTGVSAILDILKLKPGELYITGFDFFQSKTHEINKPWLDGCGGHDTKGERQLIKFIYNFCGNIKLDKHLKETL